VGQADLVLHVVDGAHADPEEQVRAVHEVLAEIGSTAGTSEHLPELLVVNKTDAAGEEALLRLKRLWPDAIFVSARSGAGLDGLREAIEARLPRPAVEVDVVVPYDRGDLVALVHERGDVLGLAHEEGGTRVQARVDESLAAELSRFSH
jgi:GTP-binding protein HflX